MTKCYLDTRRAERVCEAEWQINRAAVQAKHCAYAALSKAKYVHAVVYARAAAGHISVRHTLCPAKLPWIIEACEYYFLFYFSCFFFGQTLQLFALGCMGACGYLRVCNLLAHCCAALSSHCSSGVIKKAESESLRGTGKGCGCHKGAKETPLELSQTENRAQRSSSSSSTRGEPASAQAELRKK